MYCTQLIAIGLDNLDWTSTNFPDFVSKTRAAICIELQSTVLEVRQHTQCIRCIADGWSKAPGIDLFSEERGDTRLKAMEKKHKLVYLSYACRYTRDVPRMIEVVVMF